MIDVEAALNNYLCPICFKPDQGRQVLMTGRWIKAVDGSTKAVFVCLKCAKNLISLEERIAKEYKSIADKVDWSKVD